MREQPPELKTRFPTIIPFEDIRIDGEEHTYRVFEQDDGTTTERTQYLLDKAPFDTVLQVVGQVDGVRYEFTKGTDYDVIDSDGDGETDSIDFDTGAGERPDANTVFRVTYEAESIISRYLGSVQDEFDDLNRNLDEVVDSHYIDRASGRDLDQVGAMFGVLGKRRDRNDREYRALLKSIVQSFKGRGTRDGIRFAVAAGIGIDPSQVTVIEDLSQNTYRVQVDGFDAHESESVRELADLADPSGIGFSGSTTYRGLGANVYVSGSSTVTKQQIVLLGTDRLGNEVLGGIQ